MSKEQLDFLLERVSRLVDFFYTPGAFRFYDPTIRWIDLAAGKVRKSGYSDAADWILLMKEGIKQQSLLL